MFLKQKEYPFTVCCPVYAFFPPIGCGGVDEFIALNPLKAASVSLTPGPGKVMDFFVRSGQVRSVPQLNEGNLRDDSAEILPRCPEGCLGKLP